MSHVTTAVAAFNEYLDAEMAAKPDATWRVSGKRKATKTKPETAGEDLVFWKANAPVWLQGYHDWRMANRNMRIWETPQDVPAIELSFLVPIPGIERQFRGFIDRIFRDTNTGFLHVVDLKSGKNGSPSALQLAYYAYAVKQMWGEDIAYGSYYDARKGGLDATYDLRQFPADLVTRWLRNMHRAVTLGDYTPNISRDCSWCDVKAACFVWNPDVERPDPNTDLEA